MKKISIGLLDPYLLNYDFKIITDNGAIIESMNIKPSLSQIQLELFFDFDKMESLPENIDRNKYDRVFSRVLIKLLNLKLANFSLSSNFIFHLFESEELIYTLMNVEENCVIEFQEWTVLESGLSVIDFRNYYY